MSFLGLIEPQIEAARARLQQGVDVLVKDLRATCFDPASIVDMLFDGLADRLLAMLGRTLVLELQVARWQGLLAGDTPAARFRSFIERLRHPEVAQSLLGEYAVLADQVTICLDNWVACGLQFVRDLATDWPSLATMFDLRTDGEQLECVETGAGDPHRGGRTVTIAHFRSGARLVYRPAPVAVARHFQELLTWLNARGAEPPSRTLKILDCGDHGWTEFVSPAACSSRAQITRFYRRQGGFLALLHVLAGTDFHSDNLIADGEYPVLVDLEALFHQPRPGAADSWSDRLLQNSVLAVGLLPKDGLAQGPSGGLDQSGLAAAGQRTPMEIPCWQKAGTDEMHLGTRRIELAPDQHRPTLGETPVDPVDYLGDLCDGFTAMYRLLDRHREELLSAQGPLSWFADDETRFIARATLAYDTLLQHSYHPDRLRDPRTRDALLGRLQAIVVHLPWLASLVAAESADLNRGDIPLFSTRPGSRDLWDSQGGRLPNFFECTGLDRVRQRLTQLSEDDLETQLWIIRASFANREAERTSVKAVAAAEKESLAPAALATTAKLQSAAGAVGRRLAALARLKGAEATWLGVTKSGAERWSFGPVGLELYDGLPGITLFLFHLAALEGEEPCAALAETALETLRNRVKGTPPAKLSIGAFDGWGGVIYALTQVGLLTNRPELLQEAEDLVGHLPPLIEQDRHFDVIGGAAGCLVSLLRLHRATQLARPLALAIQCGDHLLRHAQAQGGGIAWSVPALSAVPLTGFSHGAAGVAWALLELAAVSGAERFRSAAQAALAYERGLFCPTVGNWPDFRPRPDADGLHFAVSWCHGAPGIALSRLHAVPLLQDPTLDGEIDTALQTTCTRAFGANHSLCCGDLGNLDVLLQAERALPNPHWRQELEVRTARLLHEIEAGPWRCATPGGLASPGLMTGLAGIGYGLLRLAQPNRVPSVLTLGSLR